MVFIHALIWKIQRKLLKNSKVKLSNYTSTTGSGAYDNITITMLQLQQHYFSLKLVKRFPFTSSKQQRSKRNLTINCTSGFYMNKVFPKTFEILNITLFNMLHTVLMPSLSLIPLQYLWVK